MAFRGSKMTGENTQRKDFSQVDVFAYSLQRFFSSEPNTPEEKLEFTKQIFLTGIWRFNEYYERMCIPAREMVGHKASV
jgi:hypothetical protein